MFISPLISKLMLVDPTIDEFVLKTPKSSECAKYLRLLLNGSNVSVADNMVVTFHGIACELRSEELLSHFINELNLGNALEIVQIKHQKNLNIDKEVDFIASHFPDFLVEKLLALDLYIIDSILGSESLVVWFEATLINFIEELIKEHGDEYKILLRHLHLENVDSKNVFHFFELIEGCDLEWFLPCIMRRAILPVATFSLQEEDTRRYKDFYKFYKYLTDEKITKGVIDIEDTTNFSQKKVYNLVDPEKWKQTYWDCVTDDIEGGAFIFDFKNISIDEVRVDINGYMLKAHSSNYSSGDFMKSWRVEGSNDKKTWKVIDEQKDSSALLSNMAEGYWSFEPVQWYRYIRIMMTDKNTSGSYRMALHGVDFFFTMFELPE